MSSRTPTPDDSRRYDRERLFERASSERFRARQRPEELYDDDARFDLYESESARRSLQSFDLDFEQPSDDHVLQSQTTSYAADHLIDDGQIPVERPLRRRPRTTVRREPRAQDEVLSQHSIELPADEVRAIRHAPQSAPRARRAVRSGDWIWQPIVLPQWRQVLDQAFPCLLSGISVLLTLFARPYLPVNLPLWAPMLMGPTMALMILSDRHRQPHAYRASVVNFFTIGMFLPLVIMRQSFVRVSFVEWGNGTLSMPVLGTAAVIGSMVALALLSAVLSQEDPEYSGILFAPVALLIPFFAGASEITNLGTALLILGGVFIGSAAMTVVASILPGAYPTLVAPIALAAVFFVLPVSQSAAIFPVGAGMSAKLLFFLLLVTAVALTISLPMIAVWMQRVRRIVAASPRGALQS